MNNRTLVVLTTLVIVSMLILLLLNMNSLLTDQSPNQAYLKYNNVRGMAISHNEMLYTLNFKQQNTIIDILNQAVPLDEIQSNRRQPPNIDRLIIYQFRNEPDIVLTAVAYVDQNLIFSVPVWVPNGYLMELSEGGLQKLLSQTYD